MNKTEAVLVRVDAELKEVLDTLAKHYETTISQIIRLSIEYWVDETVTRTEISSDVDEQPAIVRRYVNKRRTIINRGST